MVKMSRVGYARGDPNFAPVRVIHPFVSRQQILVHAKELPLQCRTMSRLRRKPSNAVTWPWRQSY
jgi:hypothetical protein